MSIANEIERLQNAKQAIKTSINNKGGTLTEDAKLDTFATAIDNLPSGGQDKLAFRVGGNEYYSVEASDLGGITQITQYAFFNDRKITNITIPSGVKLICAEAFYNCTNLTSVTIPSSLKRIDSQAFKNCSSLTSIELSNVTSIGHSAFYGCNKLTSITLSSGLTIITYNVFTGCSSLTSVTIPSSVTNISHSAFYGCNKLTSITIPSSVTIIEGYALNIGSTSNPATIKMISATPPTIQSSTIGDYVTRIEVPMGLGDTYRSATNWAAKASIIVEVEV